MSGPASNQLPLPSRFARVKKELIAGKEEAVAASWKRLLPRLATEIELIAKNGSDNIPSIDFQDINDPDQAAEFASQLRRRGSAVIRQVVSREEAETWKDEAHSYISSNPSPNSLPTRDSHVLGIYWSPPQVKCRAHPNMMAAHKFLMNLWNCSDPTAQVSPNFPVSYADRLRIRTTGSLSFFLNAHVDGGSVERWEPDGYGHGHTYQKIWDGDWENYDPWESSTRLKVTSDLYAGASACSMFRMFQGWLSLSRVSPDDGTLLLCPLIQLSTAYFLLRPFFSPIQSDPSHPEFLCADNWTLEQPPSSVIHGALPSYTQELNNAMHPHLALEKSMVHIPTLQPGDYVVWHCDSVYAIDRGQRGDIDATVMYISACPLTQTNALYLAHQRKVFLLGKPSPDFGGGRGESTHLGRSGVQEVSDTGGDEGLRAMGLLPWDDEEASTDLEAEVVEMANDILFPDRYDLGPWS